MIEKFHTELSKCRKQLSFASVSPDLVCVFYEMWFSGVQLLPVISLFSDCSILLSESVTGNQRTQRRCFPASASKWKHHLHSARLRISGSLLLEDGGGGEAALPYKSDGGVRRKILRTPLKGTRILFYGCVPYLFPPLRGTNSTTTKYIIGTANFDSNKDIFRTLSSQGRFGNLYWDNSGSSHFRF